jgi:hypothetical protein
MIQTIKDQSGLIALVVQQRQTQASGTDFMTPLSAGLQVGFIAREAGADIKAHRHLPIDISYQGPRNEFIYVESGCVKVSFMSDAGDVLEVIELTAGDCMLQLSGGHRFDFVEPTQLIEVKQGPYENQQQDKAFYDNA